MTARELHEQQAKLVAAEDGLRQTVYELRDDERDGEAIEALPEIQAARARVAELREAVEAGQEAFGGQVFRIPDARVPELAKKLAQIGRRCAKLGLDEPTLNVTDETDDEPVYVTPLERGPDGKWLVERIRVWRFVAVNGAVPRLAGWAFLATLQHEDGGTIIRRVPGLRAAMRGLIDGTQDRREASDALEAKFDLARFRLARPVCDHCQTARSRKDTFIVVHTETGEIKQVGRNCLADFVGGLSPEAAAKGFEYLASALDAGAAFEDEGFERGGITADPVYGTVEFLGHAALMVRKHGWQSRSSNNGYGQTPTADLAQTNLLNQRDKVAFKGLPAWEDPEDQDTAAAEAALAWIRSDEFGGDSDYVSNMKIALAGDWLNTRNVGLAASAIFVHARATEQKIEREQEAERAATALNEHVGQPKDRLELTLTVTRIYEYEGNYGVTYITALTDAEGRTFKWFGSRELERGETYTGRWTVKEHGEFKGTLETVLTRPAKLEQVES